MAESGETRPKLTIPYCPGENDNAGEMEPINTLDCKFVADYAGLTLSDVENLSVLEFWLLLHDAVTYRLSETKEGREYLERSQALKQTEPDVMALRGTFGRRNESGS